MKDNTRRNIWLMIWATVVAWGLLLVGLVGALFRGR